MNGGTRSGLADVPSPCRACSLSFVRLGRFSPSPPPNHPNNRHARKLQASLGFQQTRRLSSSPRPVPGQHTNQGARLGSWAYPLYCRHPGTPICSQRHGQGCKRGCCDTHRRFWLFWFVHPLFFLHSFSPLTGAKKNPQAWRGSMTEHSATSRCILPLSLPRSEITYSPRKTRLPSFDQPSTSPCCPSFLSYYQDR